MCTRKFHSSLTPFPPLSLPLFLPLSLSFVPPSAILRRSHSPSPKSIAKAIFRLSGSHLHSNSHSSPISSPVLVRKKVKGQQTSEDSEFVFSWMGQAGRAEVSHWRQMLDQEGDWVYCWHTLRPNLKPVST